MLLLAAALAAEVIPADTARQVEGPAVVLSESAYRVYVSESRQLPACLETVDRALEQVVEANRRTLDARNIARAEFADSEQIIDEQLTTIVELGAERDKMDRRRARAQGQRNVLLGAVGGALVYGLARASLRVVD